MTVQVSGVDEEPWLAASFTGILHHGEREPLQHLMERPPEGERQLSFFRVGDDRATGFYVQRSQFHDAEIHQPNILAMRVGQVEFPIFET